MTQDKFIRRNLLISQHLEQIADHRRSVNTAQPLIPSTPAFRELLVAQERLLLAAERMLDSEQLHAA